MQINCELLSKASLYTVSAYTSFERGPQSTQSFQVKTVFDDFVDWNYLLTYVRTGFTGDHIFKLEVWFSILLFFCPALTWLLVQVAALTNLPKKVEYFLWEYKIDWSLLF